MFRLLLFSLLASVFCLGCTSTRAWKDWDPEVGKLSLQNAVDRLGKPERVDNLPDGSQMVEWLLRRGSRAPVGYGMGASFATPGYGSRRIPHEVPAEPSRYLWMEFGPDGRLKSWRRDYRHLE